MSLDIFLLETKHFLKNPFKIVALLLFVIASVYGLHNGANLYNKQKEQINKIDAKSLKDREEALAFYDNKIKGPKDKPWVDINTAFWSIYYTNIYHFKNPSPAMVYSVGQAEQYGFYKKVTFQSSVLDADMAEEIANPERLQFGTLDFSFVLLFLSPLVLLILVYDIGSYEKQQRFFNLIQVQTASKVKWLFSRTFFYIFLLCLLLLLLTVYGAMLTDLLSYKSELFLQIFTLELLYIFFWSAFFIVIILYGKSITGNSLQMLGVYLVFTFIIPATIHQWLSIKHPTNLMVDYIDATRDDVYELYDKPIKELNKKLFELHPQLENSVVGRDSARSAAAMNRGFYALSNQLYKKSIQTIYDESAEKNKLITSTYWINPVIYFQHQLNLETETHYQDYQKYRDAIQNSIDKQIETLVVNVYNDTQVNKKQFLKFIKEFNNDN